MAGARPLNKLSARKVETVKKPGRMSDGGGLYLSISPAGAKSWVFMFSRDGRQREMGLGSTNAVTLAQARVRALECRATLAQGIDPIAHRAPILKARRTFGQCADALIKAKAPEWRSTKHKASWVSSLGSPCAAIRGLPVDEIDTEKVLAVLRPLWTVTPETAQRLRGRIEMVLNAAKAQGLRTGDNPALWRGHLDHLLARRPKLARQHHAAMPYAELPAFVAGLRALDLQAARALELLILTGSRLGEVRGMVWAEIDLGAATWVLPAPRMKSGREHRVPLCPAAVEILGKVAEFRTSSPFVFAGRSGRKPMSGQPLRNLLPCGATLHGFRSSFRDWAGNETEYPRELAEAALAHVVGDASERAYRRSDALERRRKLMNAWSAFLGY